MSTRIRAHIRSNVVGYIALFFALSGTAVALPLSGTVDHDDLQAHVVHTDKIHDGAVNSAKVLNSSLTGDDVLNSSLTGADVLNNSLTFQDIRESDLGIGTSTVIGASPFNSSTVKTATADCPSHRRVTGTGASMTGLNDPNLALSEIRPTNFDGSGQARSVRVVATETDPVDFAWGVTAMAICVDEPVD